MGGALSTGEDQTDIGHLFREFDEEFVRLMRPGHSWIQHESAQRRVCRSRPLSVTDVEVRWHDAAPFFGKSEVSVQRIRAEFTGDTHEVGSFERTGQRVVEENSFG